MSIFGERRGYLSGIRKSAMLHVAGIVSLVALFLGACNTVAPNRLSASETADLRFTALDVQMPETARLRWSGGEAAYLRARGIDSNDPALIATPQARAAIRDIAAERVKAVLQRALASRPEGTRPAKLSMTITEIEIASPAQRIVLGGGTSFIRADIEIRDQRTNALLTTYVGGLGGQYSGSGLIGVVTDAALEAGGRDDLFDRTAEAYAKSFVRWLTP
ncbi:hypothetical protein Q8W71_27745 [Methylobacterium sp. NEAU 140]|uniref:hypothetical protein n=1 Tax=Methylobacterium sp. NEAU 140 TaxID=3064945 RepID=UPI0027376C3D|nr:hypothetical protein [Methylobacterium sp. NEAU 140]MDP4026423.1 hypothetical protein [Methylobacterium sp. NEAU 140]